MVAKKVVKKKPDTRDLEELQRATKALKGADHNPVDWGAIITFIAPIISRIAIRYAVRSVAAKLKRKVSSKVATEITEKGADLISDLVKKRLQKS